MKQHKQGVLNARKRSTNLYLPEGLLEKVNAVTMDKGISRNGFIVKAIIKALKK